MKLTDNQCDVGRFGSIPADKFDETYLREVKQDIDRAQLHLKEIPANARRGLTIETLSHFKCGWLSDWVNTKNRAEWLCGTRELVEGKPKLLPPPSRRIIVPTPDMQHFNAIVPPPDRRAGDDKWCKVHAGTKSLFYDKSLKGSEFIFVLEGEVDAMSVWQATNGKSAAVAILGRNGWRKSLLPKLKDLLKGKKFILMFDKDDGQIDSKNLCDTLIKMGIPAVSKYFFDFLTEDDKKYFGQKVDANKILVERGNNFLLELLRKIFAEARNDLKSVEETIQGQSLFSQQATNSRPKAVENFDTDDAQEEIRHIVPFIPVAKLDRDSWIRVGIIMKRYGLPFDEFNQWSKDDSRYDAAVCKTQWNSFWAEGENNQQGYTIATLVLIAKEFGYVPHGKPKTDKQSPANNECTFNGNDYMSGVEDLGNARRLEKFCGEHVKWLTDSERWLIWHRAGFWQKASDNNSCVSPYCADFADRFLSFAKKLQRIADEAEKKVEVRNPDGQVTSSDPKAKENFEIAAEKAKHAWTIYYDFNKANKVNNAISLLKACSSIRITSEDLDNHTNLLNCKNGIIDLETGKFYTADPRLYITQQVNAIYRENYHNDVVEKFLRDILPDEATRAALIRWLGYCLTGLTCEEKAFLFYGDGGNGKGTLTLLLMTLFSNYATSLPVTAVCESSRMQDAGAATTELNALEKKRLAIVEELPQGRKLDTAKFKLLTGGDKIPIRRLYEEFTMISPNHKIVISGNFRPELTDARDPGLIRRIKSVDFLQRFTDDTRDPHLKEKLLAPDALNGLLTLLVAEAKAWYQHGLLFSADMEKSTRDYFNQNDFLSEFISEFCEYGSGKFIELNIFLNRLKEEYPDETKIISDRHLKDMIKKLNGKDGVEYKLHPKTRRACILGIGFKDGVTQQSLDIT